MNDLNPPESNPKTVGIVQPDYERLKQNLSDEKQPGPDSGSSPLDISALEALFKGDEQMKVAAAQQLINESKKSPPITEHPKMEAKKPNVKTQTKPINEQQGFLTPFVNGFNGLIDGIWKLLTFWIPMKQTGGGTA